MFPKNKTDCCTICRQSYSAMIELKHLKKKNPENRTDNQIKKIRELEKIVFAGLYHKEQNENCKNLANEIKNNVEEGECFVVVTLKVLFFFFWQEKNNGRMIPVDNSRAMAKRWVYRRGEGERSEMQDDKSQRKFFYLNA